ncbi:MAG: imidazoleglycerol-phosphate dehydratase, partial [Desulfuromonas sp.]
MARKATIDRKTSETEISLTLQIEGSGEHTIDSGVPFFDHMLAQVAR